MSRREPVGSFAFGFPPLMLLLLPRSDPHEFHWNSDRHSVYRTLVSLDSHASPIQNREALGVKEEQLPL
jgi:hypothetical protein